MAWHVAPFAGAWIEIILTMMQNKREVVAPFAGAWIEIALLISDVTAPTVAPFAGAWIEIYTPSFAPIIKPCRSLRGSVD